MTVIRVWRARAATAAHEQQYREHFERAVIPTLKAVAGFRGATLMRRQLEDHVEILVQTQWVSREAIRTFAGDEDEVAVVEPDARAALDDFDERVVHFEVIAGTAR